MWALIAGRGFGKTHVGAMHSLDVVLSCPGIRWAVVAPTINDLKRVCFEGVSGIITLCPPELLGTDVGKGNTAYDKTYNIITFFNGSKIYGFSAEKPNRLRGPNFHGAWIDEPAAWPYIDTLDQLNFGLRLPHPRTGHEPQMVATTTPRNNEITRELLFVEGKDGKREPRPGTYVTNGRTRDNIANLSAKRVAQLEKRYGGTRLGRQELEGELLTDVDGALWTHDLIDAKRIKKEAMPKMARVVIGVDPAVSSGEDSDLTGIVVAGLGVDDRYYIMDDRSARRTPNEWATLVVHLYYHYEADRVIAEKNQGGDMIQEILHTIDPNVSYTGVSASRGKILRAEPVAALYEQGKVSHVGGFRELEDQMATFTIGSKDSPDRLDALVHAVSALSNQGDGVAIMPGIR